MILNIHIYINNEITVTKSENAEGYTIRVLKRDEIHKWC